MRGIRSKWGTDGYKLTMGFIFRHLNVNLGMNIKGRWEYVDRHNTINPAGHADRLIDRLGEYSALSPEPSIENYVVNKWSWMSPDYLRWYNRIFSHDPSQLDISQKDGKLRIITEGPMHTGTHWEIPLLREDADLLTEELGLIPKLDWQQIHEADAKFLYDENIGYAEGGGRRPFSAEHHYDTLAIYSKYRKVDGRGGLFGTSFFNMAYDFDLMPMGTMGHEYWLLMAGIWGYEEAYKRGMEFWIEHFGKAGYLLPDTFRTEFALKDFSLRFANFFMGARHDSGDPLWFTNLMINHYQKLGIKPETKSIIYSNSLSDRSEILRIRDYKLDQIQKSDLFGQFITNRCGHKARNTVSKLVAVKVDNGPWKDVAKLSDDISKAVGKQSEIDKLLKLTAPYV